MEQVGRLQSVIRVGYKIQCVLYHKIATKNITMCGCYQKVQQGELHISKCEVISKCNGTIVTLLEIIYCNNRV